MNKKTSLLLLFVAMILFITSCQQKGTEQSPLSAALSELSGKVDVKEAADETFVPASADTVLQVNGQVQTGEDGRARLDLSSGTIFRVTPSSIFTLISNEEAEGGLATKIKLELGKIFIILNGGSAEVETPSGVASVRGSYMKVEIDSETGDIYVTCLEGSCSASNPAGTVNFTNGEKVVLFHRDPVTGNWTAPNAEPMTPEDFQEWLDENPEAQVVYDQVSATLTAIAQQPTEEPSPTPTLVTAIDTPTEAAASNACFQIIQPETGAILPKLGQIKFEWEAQPNTAKYVITVVDQFGRRATIDTTETSNDYYIEIFPAGGQYSWFVTSYDANGNEICSTEEVIFLKPQGDPTARPTNEPEPKATDIPECPSDECFPQ
jgi:hypothetical protein